MKNFIKSSLIICLLVIINSCSKNESVSELPKENISLEGDLDINFEDLTVVTIDAEGDVDEDGGFNVNTTTTTSEELPILFTKDDEVMFGYYSKTGANNTISIDDLLLFYFTAHPEVAMQGLSNSVLLSKMKSSADYAELKSLIATSLESNTSPFKNISFVELLNDSGYNLAKEVRSYKQSKTKGGGFPFQYTYTRDGKVSWPKEFPLFATVGMEINDNNGTITKPYLFEKKGLVLSPGSLISWLYDKLVTEEKDKIETFQFPSDGNYDIVFTNGIDGEGTPQLEQAVDYFNRINLAVDITSITMPIATKHFINKIDEKCTKEIIKVFQDLKLAPIKLVITDKFKLDEFMKDLSKNVYNVIKGCLPNVNVGYLDALNSASKYFNLVEDGSELMFFLRDYLGSDISGKETRYFYNDISYGGLSFTNISGDGGVSAQNEFVGASASEHIFTGLLSEDIFKYNIERGVINSNITPLPTEQKPVENLPFIAGKIGNGDAEQINLTSSTTISNSEGKLEMTFKMGTIDSQFEIKPSFEGKGLPESERIDLKLEECLKPVITGVEVICPESGSFSITYEVLVSFDTGSSGQSSGYQIGLEFQQYETNEDYQYASNSFSYSLVSGNMHKGVYKILIPTYGTFFCSPRGTRTTLRHWHNFRVYFTNSKCNYKSEYSYFETTRY